MKKEIDYDIYCKVTFKTGSSKVSGKEIVELLDIKNYLFNYFILFHN